MNTRNQPNKLSKPDIEKALNLAASLLKTFSSQTFSRTLDKEWAFPAPSQNTWEIQHKITADIRMYQRQIERYDEMPGAAGYLQDLAQHLGIKLASAGKVKLTRAFSIEEYGLISDLIYDVSVKHGVYGQLKKGQTECHEILWRVSEYFLCKGSMEGGLSHKGLQSILEKLLTTKPATFFKLGVPRDLLVVDHLQMSRHPDKVKAISIHRDYLSTLQISPSESRATPPEKHECYPLK